MKYWGERPGRRMLPLDVLNWAHFVVAKPQHIRVSTAKGAQDWMSPASEPSFRSCLISNLHLRKYADTSDRLTAASLAFIEISL